MLPLAIFVGLCACSRHDTQKSLAQRLSEADRAIATNWLGEPISGSMPLTTEEMKKVIQAVAIAKKVDQPGLSGTPDMRIMFYKGTNFLGEVRSAGSGEVLAITNDFYLENTKILEPVFWRMWAQRQKEQGAEP